MDGLGVWVLKLLEELESNYKETLLTLVWSDAKIFVNEAEGINVIV